MEALYFYTLYFCLFVGPVQLLGGIIRLVLVKNQSKYSRGLKNYFIIVAIYFIAMMLVSASGNYFYDLGLVQSVLFPIIPICIAVYYWIVVYSYSKNDITE